MQLCNDMLVKQSCCQTLGVDFSAYQREVHMRQRRVFWLSYARAVLIVAYRFYPKQWSCLASYCEVHVQRTLTLKFLQSPVISSVTQQAVGLQLTIILLLIN